MPKKIMKKQTIKSVVHQEPTSDTTTYSTRFDAKQRELIEQASAAEGCAPAKFIREAAIRRAADVLNSDPISQIRLRQLAFRVVEQILNPAVEVINFGEHPENAGTQQTITYEAHRERDPEEFEHGIGNVRDVAPVRPHDADLIQIKSALETAGTVFVRLILEHWNAGRLYEYAPKVSAAEMLKGDDEKAGGK